MNASETGHVLFRVYRRNGTTLHTFEHDDDGWALITPPSDRLRRRYETGEVKLVASPSVPDDLPPGVEWTFYTTTGGDDRRTLGVWQDGTYRLGDGIPPIREAKLHRILDGLAAAGIDTIDSDGLLRLITAYR